MAAVTTCLTKSITLQAGEPFVLPPGAEIIAASDIDGLDSVCADLDGLEAFACYEMLFGYNADSNEYEVVDSNTPTEVYLGTENKGSFAISDIYIPFPPETIPFLTPILPEGLVQDEVVTMVDATADTLQFKVVFKTVPSVAEILKLKMSAQGFGGVTLPSVHGLWFYPVTSTDCEEPEV